MALILNVYESAYRSEIDFAIVLSEIGNEDN